MADNSGTRRPPPLPDELIPRILEPLGLYARPAAAVNQAWRSAVSQLKHCIPLVCGVPYDEDLWDEQDRYDPNTVAIAASAPTFKCLDPSHAPALLPSTFVTAAVACGLEHMCLLTSCGTIFVMGSNYDGKLALGDDQLDFPYALPARHVRLPMDARASQVSCSDEFTAVVTVDGGLFISGACSGGDDDDDLAANDLGKLDRLQLATVKLPDGELAAQASLGQGFVLVVTRSGKLFGMGANDSGQLGVIMEEEKGVLRAVPLPQGVGTAVQVSCGGHFACVVTSSGALLGCGSSHFGQLGTGTFEEQESQALIALPLPAGVKAAQVSCGFFHTAVLTTDGVLLTAGDNASGQLGLALTAAAADLRPAARVAMFQPVALHESFRVARVMCGSAHTLALTVGGALLGWGNNDANQLGLGHSAPSKCESPQLIPLPRGTDAVSIGAGYSSRMRSCVLVSFK
jgi:alpha-tubulin suppressor-like RCC1 family protein